MTQDNTIPEEDLLEEDTEKAHTAPVLKVSRFGPAGFQGGSKFGKGPTGNTSPQLKQRPGRAAARGR